MQTWTSTDLGQFRPESDMHGRSHEELEWAYEQGAKNINEALHILSQESRRGL